MKQVKSLYVGSDREPILLEHPVVMGILNTTPDSFSDGGKHLNLDDAVRRAETILREGAQIIDIGGESTRPGAQAVSESEELERVLRVVEKVVGECGAVVSLDTSSPLVMRAGHAAGARIWNGTRALQRPGALELAALLDLTVVLMHRRGESDTMHSMSDYDDVVLDVKKELTKTAERVQAAGVLKERIVLDVGFGFAKTAEQNFKLLHCFEQFADMGYAQLIGLSRKRMLQSALCARGLGDSFDERLEPGLASAAVAVSKGAQIVRTHDVAATVRALSIF